MTPKTEQEAYKALQCPFVFIEKMWGFVPQEILPEYKKILNTARRT